MSGLEDFPTAEVVLARSGHGSIADDKGREFFATKLRDTLEETDGSVLVIMEGADLSYEKATRIERASDAGWRPFLATSLFAATAANPERLAADEDCQKLNTAPLPEFVHAMSNSALAEHFNPRLSDLAIEKVWTERMTEHADQDRIKLFYESGVDNSYVDGKLVEIFPNNFQDLLKAGDVHKLIEAVDTSVQVTIMNYSRRHRELAERVVAKVVENPDIKSVLASFNYLHFGLQRHFRSVGIPARSTRFNLSQEDGTTYFEPTESIYAKAMRHSADSLTTQDWHRWALATGMLLRLGNAMPITDTHVLPNETNMDTLLPTTWSLTRAYEANHGLENFIGACDLMGYLAASKTAFEQAIEAA